MVTTSWLLYEFIRLWWLGDLAKSNFHKAGGHRPWGPFRESQGPCGPWDSMDFALEILDVPGDLSLSSIGKSVTKQTSSDGTFVRGRWKFILPRSYERGCPNYRGKWDPLIRTCSFIWMGQHKFLGILLIFDFSTENQSIWMCKFVFIRRFLVYDVFSYTT